MIALGPAALPLLKLDTAVSLCQALVQFDSEALIKFIVSWIYAIAALRGLCRSPVIDFISAS